MSAAAVTGAEAFPLYPSSDDEESSILTDLSAMFPTLDRDIILTVLQTHHGQLEAAVDYLMTASSVGVPDHTSSQSNQWNHIEPMHDMDGQYSEDIGGLPEVIPSFDHNDEGEEDSETDEESSSRDSSPTLDPSVPPEDDPLPTYEEACMGTDLLPMPRYVVDQQPSEVDQTSNQSGDHEVCSAVEPPVPQQMESPQKHRVRKGKRKKLKKLAKKLSLRKSREADHKIERKRFGSGIPTPSSYQRLVDGMEMENLCEAEDETEDNR